MQTSSSSQTPTTSRRDSLSDPQITTKSKRPPMPRLDLSKVEAAALAMPDSARYHSPRVVHDGKVASAQGVINQLDLLLRTEETLKVELNEIKQMSPNEQAQTRVVAQEVFNYLTGHEPESQEGQELHGLLRSMQADKNLTVARFTHPDHPGVKAAELAEFTRMVASGELRESTGQKTLRWTTNALKAGVVVGIGVAAYTFGRSLLEQGILHDLSPTFTTNITDDWNCTMPGNWTVPTQADGDAYKMQASLLMALPHTFNLLGFVYDGVTGRGTEGSQRARLCQAGIGVAFYLTALSLGPAPAAVASGYLTGEFVLRVASYNKYWATQLAAVAKGVIYGGFRDYLTYLLPKPNPTVGSLTFKAVLHDGLIAYGPQQWISTTAGGLISGIPGAASAPFIGSVESATGAMAVVNGIVEAIAEISLGHFMADEHRKEFEDKMHRKSEEFMADMNKLKSELVTQTLRKRYEARLPADTLMRVVKFNAEEELATLTVEEFAQLEKEWQTMARDELRKHFVGVVMAFPSWDEYKTRWTNDKGEVSGWKLVDHLFGGIATARASAMASVYLMANAVLPRVNTGSSLGDSLTVGFIVAVLVVGTYVPGIMAVKRYDKPPEREDWSKLSWRNCFRQFMGGLAVGDDTIVDVSLLPIERDDSEAARESSSDLIKDDRDDSEPAKESSSDLIKDDSTSSSDT